MNPDLTELLEKLERHYGQQLPFAVYRKPGSPQVVGVFQRDSVLHEIDDFSQSGFVFVSFDGQRKIILPEQHSEIWQAPWQDEVLDQQHRNTDGTISAEAQKNFEQLVKKGIKAIENGDFDKVVLSRKEVFTCTGFELKSTFQQLLNAYPSAMAYCFFHPETGLWLGAFSEQLIRAQGKKLQTMAVAGTQLYDENNPAVWQVKEKAEQQFVTDFITESLQGRVNGIQISEPYTMKAGNLVHIKTNIEATLEESSDLAEVISILHPTPAVCGFPKENAKAFILENEGYDREFYSGFLGELHCDPAKNEPTTDLYVNLRCMKVDGQQINIFVGCGITKDSSPEKEWIETVNKSKTIKKVLE